MDPPARMVIGEDESMTALHLATQLRRLGYQVVAQACSGPQAIQQALSLHPHVVLMDVHLHGPMDGVDAVRHIQAAAPIPDPRGLHERPDGCGDHRALPGHHPGSRMCAETDPSADPGRHPAACVRPSTR
jgi:CheY-like chemotaxis protein